MELKVLYEDNHLIAVYKPAGILVQEDKTGDPSLLDQVKYYLKNKYHKPGNVYLGLIHRLDRPVSGIILFAKTSKGASRLSEQFREHEVEKVYHALVVGKPKESKMTLVHYLVKDKVINKTSAHESDTAEAQEAVLHYEVVKSNNKYSLLKIKLGTGRSHQIRAQLAAIGCPIVGDVKYGGEDTGEQLYLMATSLKFKKATEDEGVELNLNVPEEWKNKLQNSNIK